MMELISTYPALFITICIAAAVVSAVASIALFLHREDSKRSHEAKPVQASAFKSTLSILAVSSVLSWSLLSVSVAEQISLNEKVASLDAINQLPATSAGIHHSGLPPHSQDNPLEIARSITEGEEMAESPRGADFQKLRQTVTSQLFLSEDFEARDAPISINIEQFESPETIKYLAEERPGLFTVIFHRKVAESSQMVVYFPEVMGNQLIYTPLTGPASQAMSKMVSANH